MKCVYVVALFAFVALQACQAAPVPDEEKKEEVPVAVAVESTVAPVEHAKEEVKADAPKVEAAAAAPAPVAEAAPQAEEKKA